MSDSSNYVEHGILALEVTGFRCFSTKQKFILSNEQQPYKWNILIGENGTGKTTLLQLIAALFFSVPTIPTNRQEIIPKDSPGYEELKNQIGSLSDDEYEITEVLSMYHDLARDVAEIRIKVKNITKNTIEVGHLISSSDQENITNPVVQLIEMEHTNLPTGCSMFYYRGARKPNYFDDQNTKNRYVFNQVANDIQTNAYEWLFKADYASRVNDDQFTKQKKQRIENALINILPDVKEFRYKVSNDASMSPIVEALTPYGWVSVRELSLGYQTVLSWVVDFSSQLFEHYPTSENPLSEPAICLIDEIDLHLHPRWQRELIENLNRIFLNTQFIVTSHSPLVVQAAPNANLALLQKQNGHIIINNDVDQIRKWRIDQILSSELFGEQPVYAPEIQILLDERENILSQTNLSDKDKARVEVINIELNNLPSTERPADQEAMDLIRRTAILLKAKK